MEESLVALDALSDVACGFVMRHYRETEDGFHCDLLVIEFAGEYGLARKATMTRPI